MGSDREWIAGDMRAVKEWMDRHQGPHDILEICRDTGLEMEDVRYVLRIMECDGE